MWTLHKQHKTTTINDNNNNNSRELLTGKNMKNKKEKEIATIESQHHNTHCLQFPLSISVYLLVWSLLANDTGSLPTYPSQLGPSTCPRRRYDRWTGVPCTLYRCSHWQWWFQSSGCTDPRCALTPHNISRNQPPMSKEQWTDDYHVSLKTYEK